MVTKRFDETVRRRLRAGRMLLAGKTPAEAAHAVGVARQTAYTWKALLDEGGIYALRAMPARGRPARLDDEQLQAPGFCGDLVCVASPCAMSMAERHAESSFPMWLGPWPHTEGSIL